MTEPGIELICASASILTSLTTLSHVSRRDSTNHLPLTRHPYKNKTLFNPRLLNAPEVTRRRSDLPSQTGQDSLRIHPHAVLPSLINKQNPHAESHWQEPMLDRHARSVQDVLKLWHVEPKEGDGESKENRGKEVQILCLLVE